MMSLFGKLVSLERKGVHTSGEREKENSCFSPGSYHRVIQTHTTSLHYAARGGRDSNHTSKIRGRSAGCVESKLYSRSSGVLIYLGANPLWYSSGDLTRAADTKLKNTFKVLLHWADIK